MITSRALKVNYIGASTISTIKLLSTAASGKNTLFGIGSQNPKPIILPSEPLPATPVPNTSNPAQSPIVEIPGPIVEPTLPQSQPDIKPPTEIPAPTKTTTGTNVQMNMEDEVLFKDIGSCGLITLNRPKVLNALNLSMVEKIYPTLKKWETSKKLVVIESASDKAFCAGGDVKSLVISVKHGDTVPGQKFFQNEYLLNHTIGTYKIPYVALIHGITMGGGVGLSVHGKYRVATESTLFAMPETAIGFFPDVGGSYFLPRLQGQLGLYLGLTGSRLKGIDVHLAGIATHFVPSERLTELKQDLLTSETSDIDQLIRKYQPTDSKEFSLAPHLKQIENCFSASSVEEIIQKLKTDGSDWAEKTVQTLHKMSPTALKVTMSAIHRGKSLSLADCLKMEYRLACNLLHPKSDFCEGVRALLIDKDQKPMWNPKSLNEITDDYVNQTFAAVPTEKELKF